MLGSPVAGVGPGLVGSPCLGVARATPCRWHCEVLSRRRQSQDRSIAQGLTSVENRSEARDGVILRVVVEEIPGTTGSRCEPSVCRWLGSLESPPTSLFPCPDLSVHGTRGNGPLTSIQNYDRRGRKVQDGVHLNVPSTSSVTFKDGDRGVNSPVTHRSESQVVRIRWFLMQKPAPRVPVRVTTLRSRYAPLDSESVRSPSREAVFCRGSLPSPAPWFSGSASFDRQRH